MSCLDWVVWQLPAHERDLVEALVRPAVIETQPVFMWSSHTLYQQSADLYAHLVHGHLYENHAVWPRHWRVCSELDAFALYVTLAGLEASTGKRLYSLLRRQLVSSVISRQAEDGGWYHGEWTDKMEAHYRLNCGGIHLLCAALEETRDETIRAALERAVAHVADCSTKIDAGAWFLHDSLERTRETAALYPFPWIPSRAFGKPVSVMLVLNTHLDTSIALSRYQQVTGDTRYEPLLRSGRQATRFVLSQRPAEWLYRLLFYAISLTLLPVAQAKRLPLVARAVKRVGWKYLIPRLAQVKRWFPRFVMPGGYVERELAQCGWSDQYQSVMLMDFLRYRRRFGAEDLADATEVSLALIAGSGVLDRWKEIPDKRNALGFWVEALYHLCMLDPDPRHRERLASAMLDADRCGVGLSPSLLGANAEVMARPEMHACPSPAARGLRVANLSRGDRRELVVVNVSSERLELRWEKAPMPGLRWTEGSDRAGLELEPPEIPAGGWALGRAGGIA